MKRLTCRQALQARYSVLAKSTTGYSEYAPSLSFTEAQRYYNSLVSRGLNVEVKVIESSVKIRPMS